MLAGVVFVLGEVAQLHYKTQWKSCSNKVTGGVFVYSLLAKHDCKQHLGNVKQSGKHLNKEMDIKLLYIKQCVMRTMLDIKDGEIKRACPKAIWVV